MKMGMKGASSLELSFMLFLLTALLIGALVSILTEKRGVFETLAGSTSTIEALDKYLSEKTGITQKHKRPGKSLLNCTSYNHYKQCPLPPFFFHHQKEQQLELSSRTCPEYFRWIHEDLRPWAHTGITKEMVESARHAANFKLVILKGKAYVEIYRRPYQTRDIFTLWGILQLLNRYPERIPDLELMFDCDDLPVIFANERNLKHPPALFRYWSTNSNLEIVFPDWSYWGWPEINIKPWEVYLNGMKEVNEKMKWVNREPYAYWRGNPLVNRTREDLLKCHVSHHHDWSARLYSLDWNEETRGGFKTTELTAKCNYRYKIYIEGNSWSSSAKYIMACNSMTLFITTYYYEFFSRALMPLQHYWPIRDDDKCRSIKFAVEWGNNFTDKAQEIGKSASNFIQQELTMEYVYDYMFHLLNSYAKLLKFQPSISEDATELCEETLICEADEVRKEYFMNAKVNAPANTDPCTMPPPFDPVTWQDMLSRKENSTKQVEIWKETYWNDHPAEKIYKGNYAAKEIYEGVFENDLEETTFDSLV